MYNISLLLNLAVLGDSEHFYFLSFFLYLEKNHHSNAEEELVKGYARTNILMPHVPLWLFVQCRHDHQNVIRF